MQIFYEMEWLAFFFFVKCNIELFFVDPEPRGKMNVQKIPADQDPKELLGYGRGATLRFDSNCHRK